MRMRSVFLVFLLNIAWGKFLTNDLLPTRDYCGYQHSDDNVDEDHVHISLEEFPWIAQLLYDEDKAVKCTGSLINSRYVLTVAHCLKTRGTKLTGVRLGNFNITANQDCIKHRRFGKKCSDSVQEFSVEEIIPHPKFIRLSGANDIGLIRLSKLVQYSEYIRPICLHSSNNIELKEGVQVASSGWGVLGYGEAQTEIKKKIISTLISNEKCKKLYPNSIKPVTTNHLCSRESKTHTSCLGDSGGPLMLPRGKQWVQIGALSFGRWCGSEYPIVYVKVANYLDWIKQSLRG